MYDACLKDVRLEEGNSSVFDSLSGSERDGRSFEDSDFLSCFSDLGKLSSLVDCPLLITDLFDFVDAVGSSEVVSPVDFFGSLAAGLGLFDLS